MFEHALPFGLSFQDYQRLFIAFVSGVRRAGSDNGNFMVFNYLISWPRVGSLVYGFTLQSYGCFWNR